MMQHSYLWNVIPCFRNSLQSWFFTAKNRQAFWENATPMSWSTWCCWQQLPHLALHHVTCCCAEWPLCCNGFGHFSLYYLQLPWVKHKLCLNARFTLGRKLCAYPDSTVSLCLLWTVNERRGNMRFSCCLCDLLFANSANTISVFYVFASRCT